MGPRAVWRLSLLGTQPGQGDEGGTTPCCLQGRAALPFLPFLPWVTCRSPELRSAGFFRNSHQLMVGPLPWGREERERGREQPAGLLVQQL